MKLKAILLLTVFLVSKSFGQAYYGQSWITGLGNSYKVKFNNQQRIISVYDTNYQFYFHGASSCISNANGDLKIICDGYDLMDTLGSIIEDGDSLVPTLMYDKYNGWGAYPQSSIILPFLNDIYYVITPTASDFEVLNYWNVPNTGRALFDLLLYHKVDMNLNGGVGMVVEKAVPLLTNVKLSKTQMMACRHANGADWWLLKQAHDTNLIYKFLITVDSIYSYSPQGFSEPHFTKWDLHGQSMFNQEGTKYATVCLGINQLFLADFDRCTAQLSNPRIVNLANHQLQAQDTTLDVSPRGLCFSPNGSFIYIVKGYNIFQYEWGEPDSALAWYHVANLDTTWDQFQKWGSSYLGPDNKIYIGNLGGVGKAMTTIDNPDVKGAGCGFCAKCFQFPKIGAGNPPCMPNYALGADLPCWTLGSAQLLEENEKFEVYPNPASNIITIKGAYLDQQENEISVCNLLGQTILHTKFKTSNSLYQIDISEFENGIYLLKVNEFIRKIIKE
nr:T9SS type A sorting domain-containing protein [Chitinophagaceae bacterium]